MSVSLQRHQHTSQKKKKEKTVLITKYTRNNNWTPRH